MEFGFLSQNLTKGSWLSELPSYGRKTTEQNWLGPWMNRNWFFRKQVRGLQQFCGLIEVWIEMLKLPAPRPCCITIPCQCLLPVSCLSFSSIVPTPLLPKFTIQPTPNSSFEVTVDCLFPRGKVFCSFIGSCTSAGVLASLLHLIFLTFLTS